MGLGWFVQGLPRPRDWNVVYKGVMSNRLARMTHHSTLRNTDEARAYQGFCLSENTNDRFCQSSSPCPMWVSYKIFCWSLAFLRYFVVPVCQLIWKLKVSSQCNSVHGLSFTITWTGWVTALDSPVHQWILHSWIFHSFGIQHWLTAFWRPGRGSQHG